MRVVNVHADRERADQRASTDGTTDDRNARFTLDLKPNRQSGDAVQRNVDGVRSKRRDLVID